MADGTTIAFAALGITAAVQLGGIAYFAGVLNQKVTGLRKDVDEHHGQPVVQAHPERRAK